MMETLVQEPVVSGKRPTPIVRDAEVLFRRGVEALEFERIDEAVGLLRQAAELAPESAEAALGLGIALMRSMEMQEALSVLEKAVQLDPDGFFPHFRLGELYLRLGLPMQAREELRIAMDRSTSTDQRGMVRQMLRIDDQRAARRAWRPDFTRLLPGKKPRR
jgi:tetratricopeptide (TPR) repeat protein